MQSTVADVIAQIAARHPRASEERIAALTVLHFEHLMGRPVRPKVPAGLPFPDEPLDVWLRDVKALAGAEYDIAKALLDRLGKGGAPGD